MDDVLPLEPGATGDAVRDLQQRLTAAGARHHRSSPGRVRRRHRGRGPRASRQQRGLPVDRHLRRPDLDRAGRGRATGSATGCSTSAPRCMRGDDVGRAPAARSARSASTPAGSTASSARRPSARSRDFQRNAGLTTDGVCGRDVLTGLDAPRSAAGTLDQRRRRARARDPALAAAACCPVGASSSARPAASTRWPAPLDRAPPGRRRRRRRAAPPAPVGPGGRGQRLRGRRLPRAGARPTGRAEAGLLLHRPASSRPAAASWPTLVVDELAAPSPELADRPAGRARLPILRETRMPAVVCQLGSAGARRRADAPSWPRRLHRALEAWADRPRSRSDRPPSASVARGFAPTLRRLNPPVTRATTVNHSFGHRVWIAQEAVNPRSRGPRSCAR